MAESIPLHTFAISKDHIVHSVRHVYSSWSISITSGHSAVSSRFFYVEIRCAEDIWRKNVYSLSKISIAVSDVRLCLIEDKPSRFEACPWLYNLYTHPCLLSLFRVSINFCTGHLISALTPHIRKSTTGSWPFPQAFISFSRSWSLLTFFALEVWKYILILLCTNETKTLSDKRRINKNVNK